MGSHCFGLLIKSRCLVHWASAPGNNPFGFWNMFSICKCALRRHQILIWCLRERTLPNTSFSGLKKQEGEAGAPKPWLMGTETGWGPIAVLQPEPQVLASQDIQFARGQRQGLPLHPDPRELNVTSHEPLLAPTRHLPSGLPARLWTHGGSV